MKALGKLGSTFGNNFIRRKLHRLRDSAASAYDNSRTAELLKRIRAKAPSVSCNIIGLTLLFFGLYSLIFCFFKAAFAGSPPYEDIFAAISVIAVSVPWFVKRKTLGEVLSESAMGRAACRAVGIRYEAFESDRFVGRANIAFLFGTLLGALTLHFSVWEAILLVLFFGCAAVILAFPEAAVIISVIILPFGETKTACILLVIGAFSYLVKLVRRKRRLCISACDKLVMLFAFIVFVASAVYTGEGSVIGFEYFVLLIAYFLISFSSKAGELASNALAALVMSSTVAASFLMAYDIICKFQFAESELSGASLPFIGSEELQALLIICSALTVVSVSYFFQPKVISYHSVFLSIAVLVFFLFSFGSYYLLSAACIGVMLVLFFRNKRAAYTVLALSSLAFVLWLYLENRNTSALSVISAMIKELFFDGKITAYEPSGNYFVGEGLGRGFDLFGNFYYAVALALGALGIILLLLIIVTIALDCGFLSARVHKREKEHRHKMLSSAVPLFAVLTLLVSGILINIWKYPGVFAVFWILLGVSSAKLKSSREYLIRTESEKNYVENQSASSLIINGVVK